MWLRLSSMQPKIMVWNYENLMVFSGLGEGLNQTYYTLGRSKESDGSKKSDYERKPIYHEVNFL